jgi:hypothetical protein
VTDENGVDCQLNNPSIICWKEEKTLFFLPNLFSFIFHDDVGIIIVLYRGHFSCVVYVPPICCVSSTFRRTVARLVALAEVYRHVNRSHPRILSLRSVSLVDGVIVVLNFQTQPVSLSLSYIVITGKSSFFSFFFLVSLNRDNIQEIIDRDMLYTRKKRKREKKFEGNRRNDFSFWERDGQRERGSLPGCLKAQLPKDGIDHVPYKLYVGESAPCSLFI